MNFDDLRTIQVFPNGTPSDAELAAERDRKHAEAVAKFNIEQANGGLLECGCFVECYGYCTLIGEVYGL